MSHLIVMLFLVTYHPAHTCVSGTGMTAESRPCTAEQERAQDDWFEAARKCWRGMNLPDERRRCFDSIKPPLRTR